MEAVRRNRVPVSVEPPANSVNRSVREAIMKRLFFSVIFITIILIVSCGDDYTTPEDIKGHVAWVDGVSAFPNFPFGTDPIYVYFHSEASQPSRYMRENIFNRPEIIKYLNNNFTCIAVEPDSFEFISMGDSDNMVSRQDFITSFNLTGYPSHYFFNYKGSSLVVQSGYLDLKSLKQLLKYISEGYYQKNSPGEFMRSDDGDLDTIWGKY